MPLFRHWFGGPSLIKRGVAFSARISSPLLHRRCSLPSLQVLIRGMVLIVGCTLILSSSSHNWFDIPAASGTIQHFDQMERVAPSFQAAFQYSVLSGGVLWAITFLVYRRRTYLAVLIATGLLLLALSFPFFVLQSSPQLSGDATWLQMQHDNLTWLGGDINLDAENGHMAWKSTVYWVDSPRRVSVAPLPNWSASDLGLDKLEDTLQWVGYTNVFCQFARTGWSNAIWGSLSLMLFSMLSATGVCEKRAKFGLAIFMAASFVLIGIALSGPFRTKAHLAKSAQHLSQGEFAKSLSQLHRGAELFPALLQDTYYVSQKALIEYKLGRRSDYSQFYHAKQLEESGKHQQSFDIWNRLCHSSDAVIQRESLRSVLRFAIQDYNSNRFSLAGERLKFVLQRQPGNVKAIYYLQNLSIRLKDPALTYLMCDWMYEVTNYLNFQTKKTLRAVSEQNAVLAASLAGDTDELWSRTIRAKQR